MSKDGSEKNTAEASAQAEEPKKKKQKKKRLSKAELIKELEESVRDQVDRNLRLLADFDNFRKRQHRDLGQIRASSRLDAIEAFLPVLDQFQMAMNAADQQADFEVLKQGMDMILASFDRCFEELGVERIATVGERFDSGLHEAVSTEPSDEVASGHIISEWKAGYRLGDRLVRPASVVVAEAADESADAD